MADPTSDLNTTYKTDAERTDLVVKTSEALVKGAYGAISRTTQLLEFADDADSLIPVGLILGPSFGGVTAMTGDGTIQAASRSGIIVKSVSVTGASAATDFGKLVYATDGQTLTLTQPTAGVPIGFVWKWNSSTYCDVYLFRLPELITKNRGAKKRVSLGTYGTDAFSGTTLQTCRTETSLEHYKIVSLHAEPRGFDAGVIAGAQDLHLEIDAAAVTGGVLSLAYTSFDATGDMGTVINATAITAANEVHMGDVLTLVMAASGTGFTANQSASVEIFMIVEEMPGA